jgi:uncharacterized protein YjcR
MTDQSKKQALQWYVQGCDLITIAQHFGVTVETLKDNLRRLPDAN